eukprot:467522-Rhodomonas_salina.1
MLGQYREPYAMPVAQGLCYAIPVPGIASIRCASTGHQHSGTEGPHPRPRHLLVAPYPRSVPHSA